MGAAKDTGGGGGGTWLPKWLKKIISGGDTNTTSKNTANDKDDNPNKYSTSGSNANYTSSSSSNTSSSSSNTSSSSSDSGGKGGTTVIKTIEPTPAIIPTNTTTTTPTSDGGTETTLAFSDPNAANYGTENTQAEIDAANRDKLLAAQKEASTAVTNSAFDIDTPILTGGNPNHYSTSSSNAVATPVLLPPKTEEQIEAGRLRNTPIETETGGMTGGGAAGNPDIEPPKEDLQPEIDTDTGGGGGGGGGGGSTISAPKGNFWSQGMPTVEETAEKDPKKKGKGRRRRALRLGAKSLAIPTIGSGGGSKTVGS